LFLELSNYNLKKYSLEDAMCYLIVTTDFPI